MEDKHGFINYLRSYFSKHLRLQEFCKYILVDKLKAERFETIHHNEGVWYAALNDIMNHIRLCYVSNNMDSRFLSPYIRSFEQVSGLSFEFFHQIIIGDAIITLTHKQKEIGIIKDIHVVLYYSIHQSGFTQFLRTFVRATKSKIMFYEVKPMDKNKKSTSQNPSPIPGFYIKELEYLHDDSAAKTKEHDQKSSSKGTIEIEVVKDHQEALKISYNLIDNSMNKDKLLILPIASHYISPMNANLTTNIIGYTPSFDTITKHFYTLLYRIHSAKNMRDFGEVISDELIKHALLHTWGTQEKHAKDFQKQVLIKFEKVNATSKEAKITKQAFIELFCHKWGSDDPAFTDAKLVIQALSVGLSDAPGAVDVLLKFIQYSLETAHEMSKSTSIYVLERLKREKWLTIITEKHDEIHKWTSVVFNLLRRNLVETKNFAVLNKVADGFGVRLKDIRDMIERRYEFVIGYYIYVWRLENEDKCDQDIHVIISEQQGQKQLIY